VVNDMRPHDSLAASKLFYLTPNDISKILDYNKEITNEFNESYYLLVTRMVKSHYLAEILEDKRNSLIKNIGKQV